MGNSRDRTVIHSVVKAVNILKLFSKKEPMLTLGEISRKTEFTKTSALRYCNTLERLNFIEKIRVGDTPYYRLGMELFVIGSQALHGVDLSERAKPYLRKMAQSSGENSYLFIERNLRAYCIEKQTADNVIQAVTTHVGDSLPLHLGGGPSAIFASMDPIKQKEVLLDLELEGEVNKKVHKKLQLFEKHGYVISRNETYQGTMAIGAPIYNHEGITIGAVSLGGIESRFTDDRLPKLISILKNNAYNLSKELGWQGN